IAYCEQVGDYVSRELVADIRESEDEHIDWIETQLDLIARMGEQNYPQSKNEKRLTGEESPPTHGHGPAYALLALFLGALAFGAWGVWVTFGPQRRDARTTIREQRARIDAVEQQVALLSRSDQISRDANRDLQDTLAERDEEIAGLRADVAFYERFVGSTAQRHGLTVHQLELQPQEGGAWQFTATLT